MSGKSTLLRTVGRERRAGHGRRAGARGGADADAARRSAPRCASTTRCRRAGRDSSPRSRASGSIADLAGHARPRRCFCSTSSSRGPTRTIGRIGAEALLRNLVDRGAIGLTTTHDLALTAIADESGGRAVNVHFEDELQGWGAGVRLPDAARPGHSQQRAGPDESGGLACARRIGRLADRRLE